jgi:hypothetical protein
MALIKVAAFVGFSVAGEHGAASSAARAATGPRSDFNEDLGLDDVGAVHVLYGSGGGVIIEGACFLGQNSPVVEDQAEECDAFGLHLA